MTHESTNSNPPRPKAHSHSTKLKHVQRPENAFTSCFAGADLKLFVKDVQDPHSNKRPITVKSWSTIKDVKDVLHQMMSIPPSMQRLFFGPFMTSGAPLPNHRLLHDAGIYKNEQVLYLEIKGLPSSSSSSSTAMASSQTLDLSTLKHAENDICISKAMYDKTHRSLKSVIKQCRIALAIGIKPVLVLDGSGGTYFLHDVHKRKLAVFKPADEEPYAINNPRGYVKSGSTNTQEEEDDTMSMRKGIKPGEACLREVAAYLLDKNEGYSSVPRTTLVEARHHAFHSNGSMLKLNQGGAAVGSHSLSSSSSTTAFTSSITTASSSSVTSSITTTTTNSSQTAKKVGSCQEFISSEYTMDDLSPSKISVEEVQKIAILDIRILNADRNVANLLCRRNPEQPDTFELIPIDHGYCLRTVADVCWFDWCWLDWPQLKEPITPRMKEYVLGLDIEKDVRMLRDRLEIPKRALDYFRASSTLLQQGIKAGLTLYEIAVLCCRNDDAGERPSKLETMLATAAEIANSAVDNGRWHHAAASRALEQQLSPSSDGFLSSVPISTSDNANRSVSRRPSNIFKSASSVNFSSFTSSDRSQGNELTSQSMDPPDMEIDSVSESSSDNGVTDTKEEEDEEECEKWAADFIAGTLYNASTPQPTSATRRQRSISFATGDSSFSDDSSASDDSSQLSRSPQGFWFVPPSASKISSASDFSPWTPEVSPQASVSGINDDTLDLGRTRTVTFNSASDQQSNLHKSLTTAMPSIDYADVNQNEIDIRDEIEALPTLQIPRMMTRSQSYSAFSFQRISEHNTSNGSMRPLQGIVSSDEYEKYYQKFIALLIDRETTHIKKT